MKGARSDAGPRSGSRLRARLDVWLMRHAQVALASLGRLSRAPLSTLMTAAVIGVALALPTGLHLLLKNVQTLSGSWDGAATISLFLKQDEEGGETAALLERLRTNPRIDRLRVIDPDSALVEFQRLSGFGDALEALEANPLPPVVVVQPEASHSAPAAAQALVEELRALPEVDIAQLDLQWVKRFHAITEIARRGALVIASLLALAVLLIVGNTIRLEIQGRREEIEVTKLIGATDAFIRRPFLYSGLWYGLAGGAIAWVLVGLSLGALAGPVQRLALLYGSGFDLASLDRATLGALLAGSGLLGLAGSWLAVRRHLSEIEPA
ncbi:MAG: permease-like cell division protein FtsX [Chromatiales bacterium]|jgi:cell division transport system permease protein